MAFDFDTRIDGTLNSYFLCGERAPLAQLEGASQFGGEFWIGFRYLDPGAGASINVELFCDALPDGTLISTGSPLDVGARWVFRGGVLDDLLALVLGQSQVASLGLPAQPDWLRFYARSLDDEQSDYQQGRTLNSAGQSPAALPLLLRAWHDAPGVAVAFELLFAWNASSVPEKTIEWIGELDDDSPVWNSALVWREIAFALAALRDGENALSAYRKALDLLNDDDEVQRAEIAYNAGVVAHQSGDTASRDEFWNLAWQSAPEGSMIHRQLKALIE